MKRNGDDLILTHKVSLQSALNMEPIDVRTLDGRNLLQCFDEMCTPQTLRVIPGEGMPKVCSEPADRLKSLRDQPKGVMYVRFDIQFPTNLSKAQRDCI